MTCKTEKRHDRNHAVSRKQYTVLLGRPSGRPFYAYKETLFIQNAILAHQRHAGIANFNALGGIGAAVGLAISKNPEQPRNGQQEGELFQPGIAALQGADRWEQTAEQTALLPALLLGGDSTEGDVAAAFAVHVGVAEDTGLQQFLQHSAVIYGNLSPAFRPAGFFWVKSQMLMTHTEHSGGEFIRPDAATVFQNGLPLNLRAVGVGKENNVADLPDTEAAVEEMLKGMADQIEQVVCRTHGRYVKAFRPDGNRPAATV